MPLGVSYAPGPGVCDFLLERALSVAACNAARCDGDGDTMLSSRALESGTFLEFLE